MSYLDESLAPGEVIVARFALHWTAKGRLILGIVLIPLLVGIPLAIYEWLRLRAIELGVTSQRVVRKTGETGGYGGGRWRKVALLDLEASVQKRDIPALGLYRRLPEEPRARRL